MQIALTAPGSSHAQIDTVAATMTRSVVDLLAKWGDGKPPKTWSDKPTGHSRVVAAIAALDHALKSLGKRDRNGIKAKLTEQRAALEASLAGIAALAGDTAGTAKPQCGGERFATVLAGVEAAYVACIEAHAKMQQSEEGTVLACRQAVDLAEARLRTANKAWAELRTAAAFPALPDLAALAQAEDQSAQLKALARNPNARALESALLQGATTPKSVAQYWACFESSADPGELFAWRLRRFEEG